MHWLNQRPASLAFRVTFLVGLAISACLTIVGVIVLVSIENHFLARDTEELNVVAEAVKDAIANAQDDTDIVQHLESAVSGHHGIYFHVINANGLFIYASEGPDFSARISDSVSTDIPIRSDALVQWTQDEEDFRGALILINTSEEGNAKRYKVLIVSALEFHQEFLSWFKLSLWSVIIIAAVITMLVARLAVHQGHAPMHKISARIRQIGSDHLDDRLEINKVPSELLELVTSFNDMLSRIEEVFQQLSNFSADIAHELRTPLTNLTTQTQVAVSKARTLEEYRETLYSNLEEYERLSKMINDMLWLAKTDNGLVKPVFEALDPAKEIDFLFDYFEAWAEEQKVQLKLTGQSGNIQGDRSMFRRALSNLLANSIRHAFSDSQILVALHQDANNVVIDIENAGEDIPENQIIKIFDRFYRIDPSRQRRNGGDGVGLGLSIVRSIVAVHGGEVTVISKNGVTIFTVKLPVSKIETLHQS